MLNLKNKKIIALCITALAASLLATTPAMADAIIDKYLPLIAKYTYDTAAAAIEIQQSVSGALTALNDLIMKDKGDSTATLQKSFVDVTTSSLANSAGQNNAAREFTADFLQGIKIPYINDLTFPTMQGDLFLKPDPRKDARPAFNYIKNVAGLNIKHLAPSDKWTGSDVDQKAYLDFYTTINAIQTYNAYILSNLYANGLNGNKLNNQQNDLMQQASNSNWFAQVASESIGNVLRQILMYDSQTYVVLTQVLQTQQQLLSTQAMTNTLMVIGNQFTEGQLLNKAKTQTASAGSRV